VYLSEKRLVITITKPTVIVRLYPIRGESDPAKNNAVVYPAETKLKRLPAWAWLRVNSSSMTGRRGEIMARLEKLRNQRNQKIRRKKTFMA